MNQETMNLIVTGTVIPLITAIASVLTLLIQRKAAQLKEKINNDAINKQIENAEKLIVDCVIAVKETYVDNLKKNGSFDKIAQKEAFNMAKSKVMVLLKDESKQAIKEIANDLEVWIENKIEKNVGLLKSDSKALAYIN